MPKNKKSQGKERSGSVSSNESGSERRSGQFGIKPGTVADAKKALDLKARKAPVAATLQAKLNTREELKATLGERTSLKAREYVVRKEDQAHTQSKLVTVTEDEEGDKVAVTLWSRMGAYVPTTNPYRALKDHLAQKIAQNELDFDEGKPLHREYLKKFPEFVEMIDEKLKKLLDAQAKQKKSELHVKARQGDTRRFSFAEVYRQALEQNTAPEIKGIQDGDRVSLFTFLVRVVIGAQPRKTSSSADTRSSEEMTVSKPILTSSSYVQGSGFHAKTVKLPVKDEEAVREAFGKVKLSEELGKKVNRKAPPVPPRTPKGGKKGGMGS